MSYEYLTVHDGHCSYVQRCTTHDVRTPDVTAYERHEKQIKRSGVITCRFALICETDGVIVKERA